MGNVFYAFDIFFEKLEFHKALEHLWSAINFLNEYIQHSAPWKEKDQDTLSNILYTIAESLRLIAIYLYPFMPSAAVKIWKQLNLEGDLTKVNLDTEAEWGRLKSETTIRKGTALFPRIERIETV
jgi:methionyl-tRNA synthetase